MFLLPRTPSYQTKLKEKRGQGKGKDYIPWHKVQEVPSKGRSTTMFSWSVDREHHLLSDLERSYFYILDWSDQVTDIREQYPILPLEKTIIIAERLGIKHPALNNRKPPEQVVTTDFLVNVGDRLFARSIKYMKDLADRRTIEKLQIEQTFWEEQGVDWGIVTEIEIPKNIVDNIQFLHKAYYEEQLPAELSKTHILRIEKAIWERLHDEQSLSHACMEVDALLGLEDGTSLYLVRHFLAIKKWKVDMTIRINPSLPIKLISEDNNCLFASDGGA